MIAARGAAAMTSSDPSADCPAALAGALMAAFADRTGLTAPEPDAEPDAPGGSFGRPAPPLRRYLWTDAFAVCNLLALERRTGDPSHRRGALRLVDQVHETLARHRPDDERTGWISGLSEQEGRRRPTAGGLRIGKELPERAPGEPYDPDREWDRDGQYYHYLTKWMHALAQVASATGETRYHRWAAELAAVAQRRFTVDGRMAWKMSLDLTRPLVPSMGQHDPLEGCVTALVLTATAPAVRGSDGEPEPDLAPTTAALAVLCERGRWATEDPLGIGGLLTDAWRLAQILPAEAGPAPSEAELTEALLAQVLADSARSLHAFTSRPGLDLPADRRLGFRELGLALGLAAAGRLAAWSREAPRGRRWRERIEPLEPWVALGARITEFWLQPANRRAPTWTGHRNINEVMLATALVPEGFLDLPR
ncbi:MAG TPA: hypothetical protein VHQ65_10435 [Thermoanaerobaculia bacterium]|nr:hypothetical protein [Thermoanaerobaculia bacterium]